jgi:hypothetical protein
MVGPSTVFVALPGKGRDLPGKIVTSATWVCNMTAGARNAKRVRSVDVSANAGARYSGTSLVIVSIILKERSGYLQLAAYR